MYYIQLVHASSPLLFPSNFNLLAALRTAESALLDSISNTMMATQGRGAMRGAGGVGAAKAFD